MESVRLVMRMETEEETAAYELEKLMKSLDEEEEEEVEQLEEMRFPVLTSWTGPDGITVPGIMCVDDGIVRLMDRCHLYDCSICLEPSTALGKHKLCCLPCGHMFGLSCLKKWLLKDYTTRKCPQCKASFSVTDTISLYPPSVCDTHHHQKASSSSSSSLSAAAFFPLTKQGALAFKKHEISRANDVLQLQHNDKIRLGLLLTRANHLEHLQRRAGPLLGPPRIDALKRRTESLNRLASALRLRIDALGQRDYAFESRVKFYRNMYKEHHKKKCLAERAKNKKAKKAAEKKLKDKEKEDKKKMQASSSAATVDVPKEEMVEEDVADEPEEDKVEVQAKPTTKTPERVSVRSRSNTGNGPNSISKVILKRKKSNNYMYYYAAGAAAVLTMPFALGYALYA